MGIDTSAGLPVLSCRPPVLGSLLQGRPTKTRGVDTFAFQILGYSKVLLRITTEVHVM